MKKKIYIALAALPLFMSTMVGCSALHVHTIDSPYESDETSHWKTCKICHERFDEHEHTWNEFNDTCFICEYHDPLVHLNENHEVVSLTPHGMNKLTFDMPDEVDGVAVEGIAPGAFTGSKAVTVKLNKNLKYYYKEAFEGANVRIITSEEGDTIQWEYNEKTKRMEKHSDYTAMIGTRYYKKLEGDDGAFAAVTANDTTITLLKDDIKIDPLARIPVNFSISLVSYYSSASLSCSFDIAPSGILYVPETITYKGTTRLLLGNIMEKRGNGDNAKNGNKEDEVYNSGSLVFTHRETCPDDIAVGYVKSFYDEAAPLMPALGAKQVVNTAVVTLPVNHYAFGTFRFNKDLNAIKGLTEYGQTVNGLTITSPIKGLPFEIGDSAFNIAWDLKVPIDVIADTHYYNFVSKGMFFDLTIGEGITKIRDRAFNNRVDSDIDHDIAEYLGIVFSHLFTITLGDDVDYIGYRAFYDNVSLKSVSGGKNLLCIGEEAFRGAAELVTADFTYSSLNLIAPNAFAGCKSLSRLGLPTDKIWTYGGGKYFPYDLTPESLAFAASHSNSGDEWRPFYTQATPFTYTKSTKKDSLGRFNDVEYARNFNDAINNCADGGEIYISKEAGMTELDVRKIGPKGEQGAWGKSFALTIDPAVKNFIVTNSDEKLSIAENYWFAVTNAKVEVDVIDLEADSKDGYIFNNVGTFAVRREYGADPDAYNVTISNENDDMCTAKHNELTYAQRSYDAFGLSNFTIDNDNVTHIKGGSNLAAAAKSIKIASQCEESSEVVLDGHISSISAMFLESVTLTADVKDIGTYFAGSSNNIKNVTIGGGITSLDEGAFKDCKSLSSVTFSEDLTEIKLTEINKDAFNNCAALSNFDFPTSLLSIGEGAFRSCKSLGSVYFPSGSKLETISNSAFQDCKNLGRVNNVPAHVKAIGEGAFLNCESLRSFSLANNSELETIGKDAFKYCTSLQSFDNVPASLKLIDDGAFNECESLRSFTLPEGSQLEVIGGCAFQYCENLESFDNVPASLRSIGEGAFMNCKSLRSFTLPENSNLTNIDAFAFDNCQKLESFNAPASLKTIGESAFQSCESLRSFSLANDSKLEMIDQYAFVFCENLVSFDFANINTNWAVYDGDTKKADLNPDDLSDKAKAASYLASSLTYGAYVWKRVLP